MFSIRIVKLFGPIGNISSFVSLEKPASLINNYRPSDKIFGILGGVKGSKFFIA